MQHYEMLIGGTFGPGQAGWIDSECPFTGQAWARVAQAGPEDVERAVRTAHEAFSRGPWPDLTPSQRGLLLHRLGDLILRDARRLAELEVHDSGRLIADMTALVPGLAQAFHYYGGLCDKIQGSVIPLDRKGFLNFTRHEPVGVVAALTPWNSPLLVGCMMLAPALAAGCTVVLKPSEFSSVSSLEFGRLFKDAGFPDGVVNVVPGLGRTVGAALVEHPLVRAVAFTGSDSTGRQIAQIAARDFKRVVLELGGKSPTIVFDDADLDQAAYGVAAGILGITGQSCIAGSRLLVQDAVHDRFLEKLLDTMGRPRMGDPMDPRTQLAPMGARFQYEKVLDYIEVGKSEGATLVLGGGSSVPTECGKGWFIEPTVFAGVRNDMRLAREEVFGPVLSVIRFGTEEEAVAIANDTRFGLAAGVWTRDIGRAARLTEVIKAGTVWVNTYRQISFLSPFGGYKDSGMGRENGIDAVREYLDVKSVWINTGATAADPYPQH